MFVGAVLAAGVIAGSLGAVVDDLSLGMEARADALADQLRGRFDIVNDPAAMPYSTPDLTVYIKNTGDIDLYTSQFAVLIDGTAHSDLTFTVAGSAVEVVAPGELLQIDVGDAPGLSGDHLLSVIAGNGHKQSMEFTI